MTITAWLVHVCLTLLMASAVVTARTDREAVLAILSISTAQLVVVLASLGWRAVGQGLVVVGIAVAACALPLAADVKSPAADSLYRVGAALSTRIPVAPSANALAYLVLPAPIGALSFAMLSHSRRSRALWVIVYAVGATVIVGTGARASIAALVLGSLVVVSLNRSHPVLRIGLVVATVSIALLAIGPDALESRVMLWRAAISERSIGNMGYGGFAAFQRSHNPVVVANDIPLNLHNTPLQTVADFGAPGSVALLVAFGTAAWTSARCLHDARDARGKVIATGALAAMAALGVVGIVESVISTAFEFSGGPLTVISPVPLWVLALGATARRDNSQHLQSARGGQGGPGR